MCLITKSSTTTVTTDTTRIITTTELIHRPSHQQLPWAITANIQVTEERLSALAEEDITVEEPTEPMDRVESLGLASKSKCQ
jgi:hypothetical protein